MRNKPNSLNDLQSAGFSYEDACALRRIAMTLHRWHELECGDSNDYASWVITRGDYARPEGPSLPLPPSGYRERGAHYRPKKVFVHDENGKPFLERHAHDENKATYEAIPDRERGALKRLAAIMARYPGFTSYVQGDPRGASLYIVARDRIPDGASLDTCYSNGIAVFK